MLLAVEVTSPESKHRDRTVKLRKYAEAGVRNYLLIEEEEINQPVAHIYELDEPTGAHAPAGIFRGILEPTMPFPFEVDLDGLFRGKR